MRTEIGILIDFKRPTDFGDVPVTMGTFFLSNLAYF